MRDFKVKKSDPVNNRTVFKNVQVRHKTDHHLRSYRALLLLLPSLVVVLQRE